MPSVRPTFGFSRGPAHNGNTHYDATTGGSRTMDAKPRVPTRQKPTESQGRRLQTRVERNRAGRAVASDRIPMRQARQPTYVIRRIQQSKRDAQEVLAKRRSGRVTLLCCTREAPIPT